MEMNETRAGARVQSDAVEQGAAAQVAEEQVEPGGRPAAPGRLALVQRFVNTWNHEFPAERDRLGTVERATTWLAENGLDRRASGPGAVTTRRLSDLRELREAIRALATANLTGSAEPAALATINAAAAATPVVFSLDADGRIHARTTSPGAHQVVGTLLSIIHEAQVVGNWPRLKACRQCGYAFYDSSKNRSATWCSMSICGNRVKNRTYHQRQRGRAGA